MLELYTKGLRENEINFTFWSSNQKLKPNTPNLILRHCPLFPLSSFSPPQKLLPPPLILLYITTFSKLKLHGNFHPNLKLSNNCKRSKLIWTLGILIPTAATNTVELEAIHLLVRIHIIERNLFGILSLRLYCICFNWSKRCISTMAPNN